MRIVTPKFPFEDFRGYPVIKATADGFMHFANEQAVRDFMPTLTDMPPKRGYVAVLKGGYKRLGKKLADYVQKSDVERIVLVDTRDISGLSPLVPALCERHVYLKSNLVLSRLHDYLPPEFSDINLYAFPQFPVGPVLYKWMEEPLKPKSASERLYDVFFIGNFKNEPKRQHRRRILRLVLEFCEKYKLRASITNGRIPPLKYLKAMNNSRICFSPAGSGYRCRREWEILLAGSVLWLDAINLQDDVLIPDFEVNEHCVYFEDLHNLLDIVRDTSSVNKLSAAGNDLARRCYFEHPLGLDERYVRVYMLDPKANIQCYSDLEIKERKLHLAL